MSHFLKNRRIVVTNKIRSRLISQAVEILYSLTGNAKSKETIIHRLIDSAKTILHQYMRGSNSNINFTGSKFSKSAVLFSKMAKFYTVGASGLLINFGISSLISSGILLNLWYIEATILGILVSITSNFFLNKFWTFQDRDFSFYHTAKQYILFSGISCFGALIQLGVVYILVEGGSRYWTSLLFAIGIASISNFFLNKKWTFNEVMWG